MSNSAKRQWSGRYWTGADLSDARLYAANLTGSDLSDAVLTNAQFDGTNLTRANLSGSDLTGARLSGFLTNARLTNTNLTNASLGGARVQGTDFTGAAIRGAGFGWSAVSKEQIYSTASYQDKDLRGVNFFAKFLGDWDFTDQRIEGVNFGETTSRGFSKEQLYSTASYKARNLQGITLGDNLFRWDLSGQNLTNASLGSLAGANLNDSVVSGANMYGLSEDQLYSTASYQAKTLNGIEVSGDLSGWDLNGQSLTNALLRGNLDRLNLAGADLSNATLDGDEIGSINFTGARVTGIDFRDGEISKEQIYSTASYQQKQLQGVELNDQDLNGWDLNGQDLSGSTLNPATGANLESAVITGAVLSDFTADQLYSTASYREGDLRGIRFGVIAGPTNLDLNGQDLTGVTFEWRGKLQHANLDNVNLSWADLLNVDLTGTSLRNANLTGAVSCCWFGSRPFSWDGADLRGANLKSANLLMVDLDSVLVDSTTVYDQWTLFRGLDPVEAGLTFERTPDGDFNVNGDLDTVDVDVLAASIAEIMLREPLANGIVLPVLGWRSSDDWHGPRARDLNGDLVLDQADLDFWIKDLKQTWVGDVDLDGQFDRADLISVLQADKYGRDLFATWSEGDWNADGRFDQSDVILALQDGGYDRAALAAVSPVPEPSTVALLAIGCILLTLHVSHQRSVPANRSSRTN